MSERASGWLGVGRTAERWKEKKQQKVKNEKRNDEKMRNGCATQVHREQSLHLSKCVCVYTVCTTHTCSRLKDQAYDCLEKMKKKVCKKLRNIRQGERKKSL